MSNVLSKSNLFDPTLVSDLINKVKGKSSIAVLSKQTPIAFNGQKEFTFTMDSDIDVVAENGKKTHGGVSIAPITIVPIKVEYGARVSDEFLYGSEEYKLDALKAFNEGYAKKLARGLDIMAFHGLNPRTKAASTVIGDNHFDKAVTQAVTFTDANPDQNIESAVAMIQGAEGSVSGLALDPQFSAALAAMRTSDTNNVRLFPELAWGANPGAINGLPSDINTTVGAGTDDVAILGDFANMFKWGYAKEIPLEVIQYGDPDNSGQDLKGYNQVYLRSETYLGWGILDASSFARVTKAAETTSTTTTTAAE
ncbi:phage major capsid family protein [Lacticaseibacillus suihuaensis]